MPRRIGKPWFPGSGSRPFGSNQQERIVSESQRLSILQIVSSAGGGLSRKPSSGRAKQAIPDETILYLVELGQRVAAVYDFPQDIEWAWYGGELFLLQSRPITSLYPLPEGMPYEPLRVMMALSAVQGVMEPITPLGQDVLKNVLSGGGRILGFNFPGKQQAVRHQSGCIWISLYPEQFIGMYPPTLVGDVQGSPGVPLVDPRLAPGIKASACRPCADLTTGTRPSCWWWPAGESGWPAKRIFQVMDEAVRCRARPPGSDQAGFSRHPGPFRRRVIFRIDHPEWGQRGGRYGTFFPPRTLAGQVGRDGSKPPAVPECRVTNNVTHR
jgi:hypothetical protein